MIVFDLTCGSGHRFESWFSSSAAFDAQKADGAVECPFCGDREVGKAPMAPRIGRGAAPEPGGSESAGGSSGSGSEGSGGQSGAGSAPVPAVPGPTAGVPAPPAAMLEKLRELRRHVETNCDYVGPSFPEEARRIFYGESSPRDIYGEASPEEAAALREEGIETQRIPWLPRRNG